MRNTRWVLVLTLAALSQGVSGVAQRDDPDDEKARAAAFLTLAHEAAMSYDIRLEGKTSQRLALHEGPVLKWTNPVAGRVHGGVFLWTWNGRPEVVASLFKWDAPSTHESHEFHSLSTSRIVAERQGQILWTPTRPGIEFKTIPRAPIPADSPSKRLRQLREVAKDFAARQTDRKGVDRDTRLLPQPIYRYETDGGEVIDGALFAFVLGTDPETFLLIEARTVGGITRWQFAAARMNSIAQRLTYQGKEVWTVPTLPWSQVHVRTEPYISFTFGKVGTASP